MLPGEFPGQPQNDFDREPRENILTQRCEGAKKRKFNHGLP